MRDQASKIEWIIEWIMEDGEIALSVLGIAIVGYFVAVFVSLIVS